MPLEHEELTGRIIGAAIEVHRRLGPGFIESVYENAFTHELSKRKIEFARQLVVPVFYDEIEVGSHRLDFFVENEIVVELKAVTEITDAHFSIVRSYLKAVGRKHGLLINFNAPRIEVKRVIVP